MKRSSYATKQGRANGKSGRTRYADTSPFSPANVIQPTHRLAQYHARGELADRLDERAKFGDREAYRALKRMGLRP